MRYLLDTNVCVGVLRDNHSAVARHLATIPPGQIALCSVVLGELFYGAFKSQQHDHTVTKLREFVSLFQSYTFDDDAAEIYGRIRATLAVQGTQIGPNDLMIAAIALAKDLTLVTHNTREFSRVEGLRWEDWT